MKTVLSRGDSEGPVISLPQTCTHILFYCEQMKPIAHHIAELSEGRITLGQINWDRFSDQFPNLFVEGATSLKNYHVSFLACFDTPSVIFEQYSVCCALPKLLSKSFKVILPWFPTGTMERQSKLGEIATAKSLARILSTIPSSRNGPSQLFIYDIHTLQNLFYFDDSIIVNLHSCISTLIDRLEKEKTNLPIVIAFPDEGAFKRFSVKFPEYKTAVCSKVREGKKRIVKLKEGDVQGAHVVIVDDLVQSGGTLLECASTLREAGACMISMYVTHAIFPRESWKRFLDAGIHRFFVMDTNPSITSKIDNKGPFEVLSIASRTANYILEGI